MFNTTRTRQVNAASQRLLQEIRELQRRLIPKYYVHTDGTIERFFDARTQQRLNDLHHQLTACITH